MMLIRTSIAAAVAGALLLTAPSAPAAAHERGWHGGWGLPLLGAAVVGTTAAVLAAPFAPGYYAPPPRVYYAAPPVYYAPAPAYYGAPPPVYYGYGHGYYRR
jgi:hypothetical protein